LGRLIKGQIDFDNIDNVIRAASAMGLTSDKDLHPYAVADAFEYEDGEIRLNPSKGFELGAWGKIRQLLYEKILNNPYEFRAQSALKWAIEECAQQEPKLRSANAWFLTDPMLTFEYLRKEPFARHLVDRVRLGNPPELLCSAWFDDLSSLLGPAGSENISVLRAEIGAATNLDVYVNYYLDKRRRPVELPVSRQPGLPFEKNGVGELPSGHSVVSTSGIVGVVGVSRVERRSLEHASGQTFVGRHSISELELRSVFERIFKRPIDVFLMGWVGTQQRVPQLELFAAS
jgi:hypothetical protein